MKMATLDSTSPVAVNQLATGVFLESFSDRVLFVLQRGRVSTSTEGRLSCKNRYLVTLAFVSSRRFAKLGTVVFDRGLASP